MSAINLIRCLLYTAITEQSPDGGRELLGRAPDASWSECLIKLEQNRLTAPLGAAALAHGLADSIPMEARDVLRHARDEKAERNTARMELFGEFQDDLRQRDIEPIVLKSSALVALLHPWQSCNQMNDIDLWVDPHRHGEIVAMLLDQGFSRGVPGAPDGFLHPSGRMLLDIHDRFELFEHMPVSDLAVDADATFPGLDTVRVFEPTAMLSHLVFHMNEHRGSLGYQLRWILDIGFVLRAWGDEIDLDRMRQLLPDDRHVLWVFRAVQFFRHEVGVGVSPRLAAASHGVEPFTLEEVFRSQRVNPWPLTSVRGWLRIGACLTRQRERGYRLYPHASDPLLWAADKQRERRALARADDTHDPARRQRAEVGRSESVRS